MKAFRLVSCLGLILISLVSLSCQSHNGPNAFGSGQNSNAAPNSPDNELTTLPVPDSKDEPQTFGSGEDRAASPLSISMETAVINQALGIVGLPALGENKTDQETVYDRVRSVHKSNGSYSYRNPDGSYGQKSSSAFEPGNIYGRLLERAVSAGSGAVTSWAEGWLNGYGKARLNLNLNLEGHVSGSGDFLLPIYDNAGSSLFGQLGFRTMSGDRVIGNFGLGQRLFFEDNWALGYNGFLDYDFSRSHVRGGLGLEVWYDWLRLATNYYTPLSGWKGSYDYNSFFVEERPADGWDARLTGYLPFYRNLAVRGAFEQWKGEHVGAFGRDDHLNNNPKVWSVGLEWTPIPIVSISADSRYSGGHNETQIGMSLNYYFGMPLEDQLSADTVTELRTVEGSRHDFVDRQYDMILEYREKEGIYNITLLGMNGQNVFVFQVTTDLGLAVIGQTVRVTADQGVGLSQGEYITDKNGRIAIELISVPTTVTPPVMATLNVGRTTRIFPLSVNATAVDPHLYFTVTNGPEFVDPGSKDYQSTASIKMEFVDDSGTILPITDSVTWTVKSFQNPTAAWWNRGVDALNGLTWGETITGDQWWGTGGDENSHPVEGTLPTTADIKLTDVVGSRVVTLEAKVNIGGVDYNEEVNVSFGDGPLSVFTSDPVSGKQWATQYGNSSLSGTSLTNNDFTSYANTFPAAASCAGGTVNNSAITLGGSSGAWTATFPEESDGWSSSLASAADQYYSTTSHLPTVAQLVAVSRYDGTYNSAVQRKGAALAAGWQDDGDGIGYYGYWSGQVYFFPSWSYGGFLDAAVDLSVGGVKWNYVVTFSLPVTVCTGS